MTQIDPQIAFQMHFQKLMHDVFSQTNSCIQEVNDYMYQLQMSLLLQTSQMQQQQWYSYMPMQQMPIQMVPSMNQTMPQMMIPQQQQWQQPQQMTYCSQNVPTAVTPVVVQPPTPPPSVPKFTAPKVTVTPPPAPPPAEDIPIVKLRIKAKPKDATQKSGQLTPPNNSISINRNSLIDELRNSAFRKSLRKTPRKESVPKKEEPVPAWIRSRDREKRSSFNPPTSFDTLEALLLAKDHQKSMPNLRTLSRANSDERKSVSPLASPTPEEEVAEQKGQKPKPPTSTNVAIAIKAALELIDSSPSPAAASHTSSTELIPRENEDVEEAIEEGDYDPHPSSIIALPTTRALVPHRQLNPEYPEAPHGWQLLMWTIRKVGKFLKKPEHLERKDDWELIHHKQ